MKSKDKALRDDNTKIRAVIDLETTHLDESKGCVIELCILPVNDKFVVRDDIEPFHVLIYPDEDTIIDPIAMDINGIDFNNLDPLNDPMAYDSRLAIKELYLWKKKHGIKHIYPIAQNWEFDSKFYKALTKDTCMENLFYHRASDTQRLAQSINDASIATTGKPVFENTKLETLAGYFNIDYTGAHRALDDCKITLEVYKKLLAFISL